MTENPVGLIPHPSTGEAVEIKSQPTDVLADLHDSFAAHERDLRSYRRAVDDEIVDRMDFEGKRTYHGEGFTLEVSKPTERAWDIPLLRDTLDRLVADGIISPSKAEQCIRCEPKVAAMEVRPLETDPRCQRQIAACYQEVPARRSVKVKG